MKRIIAANSNCYHGYSIEDAIQGISAAGFRSIELTATKGWTEHVFPTMPFERLLRIQDMLKSADLTPFAMSGHCNLMDPARHRDFEDNMRMAAFFGCNYIVSSIGEAHLEDKAVADNAQVARHIRQLVPYLDLYNLTLVLETHGKDHATGAILSDIIERVGHQRVQMNYDTANVIFFGDETFDLKADMKASMSHIAFIHLKEKAGWRNEWNFPAIGKGWIDFPGIFRMLEEAGNTCPLSIEIEFTKDGPKDLAEINAAVKDSAEYLKAQGFAL